MIDKMIVMDMALLGRFSMGIPRDGSLHKYHSLFLRQADREVCQNFIVEVN